MKKKLKGKWRYKFIFDKIRVLCVTHTHTHTHAHTDRQTDTQTDTHTPAGVLALALGLGDWRLGRLVVLLFFEYAQTTLLNTPLQLLYISSKSAKHPTHKVLFWLRDAEVVDDYKRSATVVHNNNTVL